MREWDSPYGAYAKYIINLLQTDSPYRAHLFIINYLHVQGSCRQAGLKTLLLYVWTLVLFFCLEKRQPAEKGFLFGYPIVFKKRNGIMVDDETLAGGLYK